MNPVLELQQLLGKLTAKRQVGKVTQVRGSTIIVSVGNGLTRVKNNSATVYKIGDMVSVQGGVLLGKAGSGLQPKVFHV